MGVQFDRPKLSLNILISLEAFINIKRDPPFRARAAVFFEEPALFWASALRSIGQTLRGGLSSVRGISLLRIRGNVERIEQHKARLVVREVTADEQQQFCESTKVFLVRYSSIGSSALVMF